MVCPSQWLLLTVLICSKMHMAYLHRQMGRSISAGLFATKESSCRSVEDPSGRCGYYKVQTTTPWYNESTMWSGETLPRAEKNWLIPTWVLRTLPGICFLKSILICDFTKVGIQVRSAAAGCVLSDARRSGTQAAIIINITQASYSLRFSAPVVLNIGCRWSASLQILYFITSTEYYLF